MKRYSPFLVVLLATAFLMTACGGTVANSVPTVTPLPTDAPAPSPTPIPTVTLPPPTATAPAATVPAAAEPVATEAPTAAPTDTVALPTPTPDWLLVEGRSADGLPTLGNPDAPITVLDYSDFL